MSTEDVIGSNPKPLGEVSVDYRCLQGYDAVQLALECMEKVSRGESRKYYRVGRPGRWYGGIATADSQHSGKSNLMSNIIRRIILHTKEIKMIIFDISSEYPFLLSDLFADVRIPSKIILETPVKNVDQFYVSIVKPREYKDDPKVKDVLKIIYDQGKVEDE